MVIIDIYTLIYVQNVLGQLLTYNKHYIYQ